MLRFVSTQAKQNSKKRGHENARRTYLLCGHGGGISALPTMHSSAMTTALAMLMALGCGVTSTPGGGTESHGLPLNIRKGGGGVLGNCVRSPFPACSTCTWALCAVVSSCSGQSGGGTSTRRQVELCCNGGDEMSPWKFAKILVGW